MPAARSSHARALRDRSLWYLLKAGQRVGVDVAPHHFYSNTPDLRALQRTTYWRAPHRFDGVRGSSLTEQSQVLARWVTPELTAFLATHDIHADACAANGEVGYGRIEAELLYSFVRTQQPARVVQVGSGVSTEIVLRASREHGLTTDITCIDPFPTPFLREAARRGEITLIIEPAQVVSAETFDQLGSGDLLFIDSTHTVKIGSEVNRLILDVLPALAPGVYVHFHDIYFPYDHGPQALGGELFFWNESVLLHAFLSGNEHMTIMVSGSMLHHGAPDALSTAFPGYVPLATPDGLAAPGSTGHFPSATYLRRL